MQTRIGTHTFALLPESYLQKTIRMIVLINYTEFINFTSFLCKKIVVFIYFSKLPTRRVDNSKH